MSGWLVTFKCKFLEYSQSSVRRNRPEGSEISPWKDESAGIAVKGGWEQLSWESWFLLLKHYDQMELRGRKKGLVWLTRPRCCPSLRVSVCTWFWFRSWRATACCSWSSLWFFYSSRQSAQAVVLPAVGWSLLHPPT